MLGPGGTARSRFILRDRVARRLQPQQQAQRAFPLPHHAHRLRRASARDLRLPPPLLRQPQTIERIGIRRHELRRQPPSAAFSGCNAATAAIAARSRRT